MVIASFQYNERAKEVNKIEKKEEETIVVIKNDGSEQLFSVIKLGNSIRWAVEKTGRFSDTLQIELAKDIFKESLKRIEGCEKISSVRIKDTIFWAISSILTSIYGAWTEHETLKRIKVD